MTKENDNYNMNSFDLCLVTNVRVPKKFKVPEFKNYNGVNYPKNHLIMYHRNMAPHTHYDKLLVHLFQDSLTGEALSWYMHLKREHIFSWKDLVEFL